MSEPTLSFGARLWFAWAAFFRILFDGAFAYRAFQVREHAALPAGDPSATAPGPDASADHPPVPRELMVTRREGKPPPAPEAPSTTSALQLLALFQREGRLIDFLEQEIASFSDAEVGAATRVVHEGCRKALRAHATFAPIRSEEEGARVELKEGYSPAEVKLTGNVQGTAPYRGVLQHRGWRAAKLTLPTPVEGHDATVIAPAEVEL